jgi:hypothetical protein
VAGETLCISVVTPSVVPANKLHSLAFADAAGNLIGEGGRRFRSPATPIYSLALPGSGSGTRAPVQPLVAIGDTGRVNGLNTGDSGGIRGIAVTAELIDKLTHRPRATYVWTCPRTSMRECLLFREWTLRHWCFERRQRVGSSRSVGGHGRSRQPKSRLGWPCTQRDGPHRRTHIERRLVLPPLLQLSPLRCFSFILR